MYVVGARRIKVGEAYREPGEPVPEAAEWPNAGRLLRRGDLVQVPDPAPASSPKASSADDDADDAPKRKRKSD